MSVKIRLQRHGKKGKPFYWVVAADARSKRDGKYLEKIGTYNPNTNPATIDLNLDSAVRWLHNGAQPTDTAKAILSYKFGEVIYLYVTTEIMPSVREFEYQFKDISGLILEYESIESGGLKINCTAVKIDLSPVQASIFNIPTSGYRVLN